MVEMAIGHGDKVGVGNKVMNDVANVNLPDQGFDSQEDLEENNTRTFYFLVARDRKPDEQTPPTPSPIYCASTSISLRLDS
jgi:hypothetical protein